MILFIVLLFLIVIYIVKKSGNDDIAKQHSKTPSDKANVANARKVYRRATTEKILLIATIVSIIVLVLLQFTDIGYIIEDYISPDFVERREFNPMYYLLPCYLFVTRIIIVEVRVGDYIYKYFNLEEPELDVNAKELIKSMLYKKSKPAPVQQDNSIVTSEGIKAEATQIENVEVKKAEPVPQKPEPPKEAPPTPTAVKAPEKK